MIENAQIPKITNPINSNHEKLVNELFTTHHTSKHPKHEKLAINHQ